MNNFRFSDDVELEYVQNEPFLSKNKGKDYIIIIIKIDTATVQEKFNTKEHLKKISFPYHQDRMETVELTDRIAKVKVYFDN